VIGSMTRASDGGPADLLIALPREGDPMRRRLAAELREAIRAGRLRTGVRLPASRVLAAQLGVSRGVVTDAYEQLTSEGWLAARRGAGTVVAAGPGRPPASEPPRPCRAVRADFTPTTPDVSLFPRRLWARAVAHATASAPDAALDYGEPAGARGLREALADHLGRTRGTVAAPGAIVVCAGYHQAIALLCGVLGARGATRIAFEDPSLQGQWDTAARAGLEPVPAPVDADGLRVDALARTGADAVVVTPSHQFPTGAVMAPERRHALPAWARAGGRLVVEDDYEAEFRYDRRATGALQGLDREHVAYVGTAAKTLAPALRLGWIVAPDDLAPALGAAKEAADHGSPTLDQLALAHLMRTGELDRHLRRVRRAYAERRDRLVAALAAAVPDGRVEGAAAGVHLVLALPHPFDADRLAAAAAAEEVAVTLLDALRRTPHATSAARLVLGYGRIPTAGIEAAVAALARALRTARGGP
jgi:GntR family transcriptional regulator / MocR family aminotransferase